MEYFKHSHQIERFELLENGKCYPPSSNISLRSQLYLDKRPILSLTYFPSANIPPSEIPAHQSKFAKVEANQKFGPSYAIFWFKIEIEVPETWHACSDNEIHLLWDSGNEALLFNSDCSQVLQGFSGDGDYNKRAEYIIRRLPFKDDLNSSSKVTYFLEMCCNNLFGNGPMLGPKDKNSFYSISECSIGLFNRKVWDLLCDFIIVKDSADKLDQTQSNRSHLAKKTANKIMDIVRPNEPSTYEDGRKLAESFLKCKNSESQHQIYAIGHCHIDTAWLWNFETTRKKTARSWSTQLELMKFYPDFKFCASQAQQFAWLKNDYPSLFTKIQEHAKNGRFLPVGGSWVEFDGNVPSGESMVRQFLYGQYFFKENFGSFCSVFFMPDTFGYSPQLPQIMREAGISNFLTQKLSWNLINVFPHTNFRWKGIDGSEVLAHFPPADTYCSKGNVEEVMRSQTNFKGKGKSNCSVLLFGNGDGGGGPKFDYIESLIRMEDLEGIPKVKLGDINEFYNELQKVGEGLDIWEGELYLELHNGTYTTMAENKKWNRKLEIKLRFCEMLMSFRLILMKGEKEKCEKELDYYHGEFKELWKLLLLDQFHDVLPGTSVSEVYEDTRKHFVMIDEKLNSKLDELLEGFAQTGGFSEENQNNVLGYFFYNSLNYERSHYFELMDLDGFVSLPKFTLSFLDEKALSDSLKSQSMKQVFLKEHLDSYEIENNLLCVKVSKKGIITSILDKRTLLYGNEKTMKEAVFQSHKSHPGCNSFLIHEDVPFFWDAWDIFPYYKDNHRSIIASESKIIKESNHQVNIHFSYKISSSSSISQNIILYSNSPRIEFKTEIDWHETHKLLRVYFPLNIKSDYASFDIQNGVIRRATHNNTSWDVAKHEVYGHKFVDLSENDYGVSLLTDCKYGYSAKEGVLGLSLLKSPKHPNENADMGRHIFTYSLFLHRDSDLSETLKESEFLNNDLLMKKSMKNNLSHAFLEIDKNNIVLDCFKPCETTQGSFALRVHEHLGQETCFRICFSKQMIGDGKKIEVWLVDLLENEKIADNNTLLGVEAREFMRTKKLLRSFLMLKYKISFQIHFHCVYGQQIVLVGNIPQLGDWDVKNGVNLDWTQGDIWRKDLVLFNKRKSDIEYKYVVCEMREEGLVPVKWEAGSNRAINCSKTSKLEIFLNDVWEHRKVCLRIRNSFHAIKKSLHLIGNVNDLKVAKKMDLIYKKDPQTDSLEFFWQKEFYVEVGRPSFKYNYVLIDQDNKKGFWEREYIRTFFFNEGKNEEESKKGQGLAGFLRRDKNGRSLNELMSCSYKNNVFKIYDADFNDNFVVDEINENIIIGPYPQTESEIQSLSQKGVKAVLNLQRDVDMRMRKLDWNDIKGYYEENQIDVINYQINDSDQEELTEKIIVAADILNKLIKKYKRVYVHCTAGIIRAPHTVIAYLCLFKHYPLENAIRFLKKKRPIAHPNKRCLEKALTSLNVMSRCITFI